MEIAGEREISIIAIRVGYNVLMAGIVAAFCLVGVTWGVTVASQDTSILRIRDHLLDRGRLAPRLFRTGLRSRSYLGLRTE